MVLCIQKSELILSCPSVHLFSSLTLGNYQLKFSKGKVGGDKAMALLIPSLPMKCATIVLPEVIHSSHAREQAILLTLKYTSNASSVLLLCVKQNCGRRDQDQL